MRAPERDHALDFWGRLGFPAVLKGLALVGKYFFSRKVTQQYPEVPTVPLRDFRG
ncbi:MAG: hypothetical protein HYW16_00035, partial [Candidatus Rokubacteria bacterium]|nr:hypothetical protein [Candidatus Rokubacteria bacterium]